MWDKGGPRKGQHGLDKLDDAIIPKCLEIDLRDGFREIGRIYWVVCPHWILLKEISGRDSFYHRGMLGYSINKSQRTDPD